jgi:hypothetical protein
MSINAAYRDFHSLVSVTPVPARLYLDAAKYVINESSRRRLWI